MNWSTGYSKYFASSIINYGIILVILVLVVLAGCIESQKSGSNIPLKNLSSPEAKVTTQIPQVATFPLKTTGNTGEWLSDGNTALKVNRIWRSSISPHRSGYDYYYLDYEIGNPTASDKATGGVEIDSCSASFCQKQYTFGGNLMQQLPPSSTLSERTEIEVRGPPDYIRIRFLSSYNAVHGTYVIYPLPEHRKMPPEVEAYFEGRSSSQTP